MTAAAWVAAIAKERARRASCFFMIGSDKAYVVLGVASGRRLTYQVHESVSKIQYVLTGYKGNGEWTRGACRLVRTTRCVLRLGLARKRVKGRMRGMKMKTMAGGIEWCCVISRNREAMLFLRLAV